MGQGALAGGALRPDATAIWERGVVERVTSGLRCTRIDLQPLGRQMLMVADRLATLSAVAAHHRWCNTSPRR